MLNFVKSVVFIEIVTVGVAFFLASLYCLLEIIWGLTNFEPIETIQVFVIEFIFLTIEVIVMLLPIILWFGFMYLINYFGVFQWLLLTQ